MSYNLYYAPDGSAPEFVGEYETLEECREAAAAGPRGLEQSLWDTARAAGHCGGMYAPDADADEPAEWMGPEGWHCACEVTP